MSTATPERPLAGTEPPFRVKRVGDNVILEWDRLEGGFPKPYREAYDVPWRDPVLRTLELYYELQRHLGAALAERDGLLVKLADTEGELKTVRRQYGEMKRRVEK